MTNEDGSTDGEYWVSRAGIKHSASCGAGASDPCLCDPPYPIKPPARRAAIFIDVDGTLLPFDTLVVPTSVKENLHDLIGAADEVFDCVHLVWSTAWLEDADPVIGAQVGLNGLPYLPFELPWEDPNAEFAFVHHHNYKIPDITRYVKNHKISAAIILDDEIEAETDPQTMLGIPTHLVQTKPNVCLTAEEVTAAMKWMDTL